MSANVLIITGDTEVPSASGRPLRARGANAGARVTERSVEEVKKNMSGFLTNLGQILSLEEEIKGEYSIDCVEVNAEITGEGKIGFLGSGVNVGATTGLKIVLQRKSAGN